MHFLSFNLNIAVPNESTIRSYRKRFTASRMFELMMLVSELQLRGVRHSALGGQIIEATLVLAANQRRVADEKTEIKVAKSSKNILRIYTD